MENERTVAPIEGYSEMEIPSKLTPEDMVSYGVVVDIFKTPEEAPHYGKEFKMLKLKKCALVGKGTKSGKSTVDLQLTDAMGNQYLVVTTGAVIQSLATTINGVEESTMPEFTG